MSRSLPHDVRRPLSFGELIATLDSVIGETVAAPVGNLGLRSRFVAIGELRRRELSWAPAFSIGDLFVIVLDEPDYRSASISTYDEDARFEITLTFRDVSLSIGSPDLLAGDIEGF